jgi:hypothetical protein
VIPRAQITAWRVSAPWPTDAQVEQDRVLSRAVVELFSNPKVAETMASAEGPRCTSSFWCHPDATRKTSIWSRSTPARSARPSMPFARRLSLRASPRVRWYACI